LRSTFQGMLYGLAVTLLLVAVIALVVAFRDPV
jgi:tetrahydromethanopterin S-methyltransferase subunit G